MKVNLVLVIVGILMAVMGAIFLYLNMSSTVTFFKGDVWYYVSGLMLILGVVMAIGALLIGASDTDANISINQSSLTPPSPSVSKPSGFNITFSSAPSTVSSDANMSVLPGPGEAVITSRSTPGLAGLGYSLSPSSLSNLSKGYGTVGLH